MSQPANTAPNAQTSRGGQTVSTSRTSGHRSPNAGDSRYRAVTDRDGRTRMRERGQGRRGRASHAHEDQRSVRIALATLSRAGELFALADTTTDRAARRASHADGLAMAELARRQIDELLELRGKVAP